MAATIQIHEMSALAAGTDKTDGTVRFKLADDATVDTNDPMVVPEAGSDYSYEKTLRAYMEAPPDTQVSNLRWYTDGSNGLGTGVTVAVKNIGVTWSAHADTEMADGSDLFGYTSASPLDGDAADTGPFVPADDDSYIGDLIRMQMTVASTASNGATPTETLTLAFDEI